MSRQTTFSREGQHGVGNKGRLHSYLGSTNALLCDLGQVTFSLLVPRFPYLYIRDNNTSLPRRGVVRMYQLMFVSNSTVMYSAKYY